MLSSAPCRKWIDNPSWLRKTTHTFENRLWAQDFHIWGQTLWCCLWYVAAENVFPQYMQAKGFTLMWILSCLALFPASEKGLKQMRHWYGFTPVCILSCLTNELTWRKHFLQTGHLCSRFSLDDSTEEDFTVFLEDLASFLDSWSLKLRLLFAANEGFKWSMIDLATLEVQAVGWDTDIEFLVTLAFDDEL